MSSLSRQLADGQSSGGGGYSIPGALHALSTDDDGMLTYTRTLYTGAITETIGANFNSSDSITDALPTSYFNFDSNNSDYDPVTGHKLGTTRFDQFYQEYLLQSPKNQLLIFQKAIALALYPFSKGHLLIPVLSYK